MFPDAPKHESSGTAHRVNDSGRPVTQYPELRDAWVRLQSDYLDEAREAAGRYLAASDASLATEAMKIVALASFRKREYERALPLYERVAQATGNAGDLFNLMICYAMLGHADRAEQLFGELARLYNARIAKGGPPLPMVWLYLGCALRDGGHPARALPLILKLRPVYEELNITDATYLYVRGVPSLSETTALARDVFRALGDQFDASAWIREFAAALDPEGRSQLEELAGELKVKS